MTKKSNNNNKIKFTQNIKITNKVKNKYMKLKRQMKKISNKKENLTKKNI